MLRLLMVATVSQTLSAFLLPHIQYMQQQDWIVDGAANGILTNQKCINTFNSVYDIEWSRSPLDIKHIVKSMKRIRAIVKNGEYDIVHVHTPIAAAVTRFALRDMVKTKKIKMIYTAHGFHFYKGAPLLNWLIYYPIEKYLSRYTDVLITINKEDYEIAKNKMHAKKTEYIPGVGIDVEKIQNTKVDKNKKREELGIPQDAFVLISVGELNKNKNHEVVIKALKNIADKNNIHYIIAGQGPLYQYLLDLADDYGLKDKVHLLGFRTDVIELLKSSDCFVFPSRREGLPVALIEAMACGLPVVCSQIRGNVDLITDGVNGYLWNITDGPTALGKTIMNTRQSVKFCKQCSLRNIAIAEKFDIHQSLSAIERIYKETEKNSRALRDCL